MRTGVIALLLLLITACGRPEPGNEANGSGNLAGTAAGDDRPAAASLVLAASGPGGCSATWDGQAATVQQVSARSAAAVERGITEAGGLANVTREALPAIAVEAPAGLAMACADTYLSALRRAGVVSVLLKPAGGAAPALADFSLTEIGAPSPSVVIAIGAGGRLTWNNERIGPDALPGRLRELGGGAAAPQIEAPPGQLELRPAREASFGQLHDVLAAVRVEHIRAALLLPSVRPPSAPAPAPAPPPAAGNAAAPAR